MLAILVGIVVLYGNSTLPPRAEAQMPVSFTLDADLSGWNFTIPGPTLVVGGGDMVSMLLRNQDGLPHQFFIDVNGNGIDDCTGPDKCSELFSGTSSTTYTFTADMAAASYNYYCSIHGQMRGSFQVAASENPDFSISANPGTISVQQSTTSTSTIAVASQAGFTGTVNLSINIPVGLSVSLSSYSVSLSSGSSGSVTLTVTAASNANTGQYQLNLTGTSGSLSHILSTVVLVAAASDNAPAAAPIPITLILGFGIVAAIVVLFTAYVLRRGRHA